MKGVIPEYNYHSVCISLNARKPFIKSQADLLGRKKVRF
jgi:hypothetical protein